MMSKKQLYKPFALLLCLLALFCTITPASSGLPSPTSLKYVNDYTHTLSDSELKQVISLGKELEDLTGAQAVLVLIPSTENVPIADYALTLFRTWGIGEQGKDNGLLMLIALNDRTWRVEVGRGLEGAIPDALSNRIMEELAKPLFMDGRYADGSLSAYSTFCDAIATEYGITLTHSLHVNFPTTTQHSSGSSGLPILLIILVAADILLNRGRIFSSLLQVLFWSNIGRRGGRGGGGASSGGGGFGGFGGGSSNGGGSSGSW
ncbi:MAG: TPM domain-containing protein [Cellulosilyticaceae bacterium]